MMAIGWRSAHALANCEEPSLFEQTRYELGKYAIAPEIYCLHVLQLPLVNSIDKR